MKNKISLCALAGIDDQPGTRLCVDFARVGEYILKLAGGKKVPSHNRKTLYKVAATYQNLAKVSSSLRLRVWLHIKARRLDAGLRFCHESQGLGERMGELGLELRHVVSLFLSCTFSIQNVHLEHLSEPKGPSVSDYANIRRTPSHPNTTPSSSQ